MPIKKSAMKELRKTKKRALKNKRVLNNVKNLLKKSIKEIEKGGSKADELVKNTLKALDKAAQKGVIKKNTAGRRKSRLMRRYNSIVKK